ncbi:MAG: HEPN domain-containing protein [Desulfobacteraceae bacterium]|nr:HEPN domain-containing protein [Desulfobacteraceae bacterium]
MKEEFLQKAKENLVIAKLSFEHKCYNASANRAYFAVFQSAIAALDDKGFLTKGRNDHKWIQSEFSEKLIKRKKIYPAKIKSYLMKMQMLRNMADYEYESVSKKDTVEQIRKAEEMIGFIQKEIEK